MNINEFCSLYNLLFSEYDRKKSSGYDVSALDQLLTRMALYARNYVEDQMGEFDEPQV